MDKSFDDGRTLLRADYSIDCASVVHARYRVVATVMAILYVVGTLVLHLAILAKYRQLLYPPHARGRPQEDKLIALEAKQRNMIALRPLALLHDACKFISIFHLPFSHLATFTQTHPSYCERQNCCQSWSWSHKFQRRLKQACRLRALVKLTLASCIDVFPSDEPRAWWYEIAETCRRIILAGVVCLTSVTLIQLWVAICVTLVRFSYDGYVPSFAPNKQRHADF